MATNGVILLNLENRNAAEFQRLSVPDSYEKASGALTAGTYVTVYKWLYQGFMLAPSLCDAVDATDHINLVDRTNGGIISVYPDDTISLEGGVAPDPDLGELTAFNNGVYEAEDEGLDGFSKVTVQAPEPEFMDIAYHVYSGDTTQANASLMVQKGHYMNGLFYAIGEPVEVTKSMASPWPYILDGIATISWSSGWLIQTTAKIHQLLAGEWVYALKGNHLEMWDYDSSNNSAYLRTWYPINVS